MWIRDGRGIEKMCIPCQQRRKFGSGWDKVPLPVRMTAAVDNVKMQIRSAVVSALSDTSKEEHRFTLLRKDISILQIPIIFTSAARQNQSSSHQSSPPRPQARRDVSESSHIYRQIAQPGNVKRWHATSNCSPMCVLLAVQWVRKVNALCKGKRVIHDNYDTY